MSHLHVTISADLRGSWLPDAAERIEKQLRSGEMSPEKVLSWTPFTEIEFKVEEVDG